MISSGLAAANVSFGGDDDVVFSSDDWTLKINVDIVSQELIFETVLAPNKWLAIGLAYDLLEADII